MYDEFTEKLLEILNDENLIKNFNGMYGLSYVKFDVVNNKICSIVKLYDDEDEKTLEIVDVNLRPDDLKLNDDLVKMFYDVTFEFVRHLRDDKKYDEYIRYIYGHDNFVKINTAIRQFFATKKSEDEVKDFFKDYYDGKPLNGLHLKDKND